MQRPPTLFRTLGLILFFAGILLGTCLAGGLTWANLEADFYFGFGIKGDTTLDLSCPLIMTPVETGQVAIAIHNASDRQIKPLVQVDLSGPLFGSTIRDQIPVGPGTTQRTSWEVDSQDIAFGHLILAKVYQSQTQSLRSASDTCGILILNVSGLSGQEIYLLALGISALVTALGFLLWAASYRSNGQQMPNETGASLLLVGIVGIGILIGSLGWWLPGVLAVAASLLLTTILVGRQVNARV